MDDLGLLGDDRTSGKMRQLQIFSGRPDTAPYCSIGERQLCAATTIGAWQASAGPQKAGCQSPKPVGARAKRAGVDSRQASRQRHWRRPGEMQHGFLVETAERSTDRAAEA
jgi:hypothetical protein